MASITATTLSNILPNDAVTAPVRPTEESRRLQLDGIRAVAVVLVMIQHYDPGTTHWVELGAVGVQVFFVLSGFLITGILLRARQAAEADGFSKWTLLRNFYARRFLRIFPIYYLVILLIWLASYESMRQSVGWHLGYLSNFYFFQRGTGNFSVTHFWSLAVEEQFYLLWPLLILFLPRKWLLPAIVSAIGVGPLFRLLIVLRGGNSWQATILTPGCLDTLGMGALIAFLSISRRHHAKRVLLQCGLFLGLPMYVATAFGAHFTHSAAWAVPFGLSIALWSGWLIDRAFSGFTGVAGKILSFKPAVYLGTISYGVYVIHNFIPTATIRVLNLHHEWPMPIRPLLLFFIAVLLASVSWYVFEKPIIALKRYFPYCPSTPPKN